MAIAVRTGTTAASNTSSAALTIPTAVRTGDLMVMTAVLRLSTASGTITTPAGWSVAVAPTAMASGAGQQAVFTRPAAGAAGSISDDAATVVTVTATGGAQQLVLAMVALQDAATALRSSTLTSNGSGISTVVPVAAAPDVVPGDLVLLIGAARSSPSGVALDFTAPTGYSVLQQRSASSGTSQNVACFIAAGTAAGSQNITASAGVYSVAGQSIVAPTPVNYPVAATWSAATGLSSGISAGRPAGAAWSAGTAMGAGLSRTLATGAAFSADSAMSITARAALQLAAAFSADSAMIIMADGSAMRSAGAGFSASTNLVTGLVRVKVAAATWSAAGALAADVIRGRPGAVVFSAASAMHLVPTELVGAAAFSAGTGLSATLGGALPPAAASHAVTVGRPDGSIVRRGGQVLIRRSGASIRRSI